MVDSILNYLRTNLDFLQTDFTADPAKYVWMLIGFVGEGIFFSRFVIQWIATERKKRTVVPMAFWYLSILGSAVVLAYSIHKLDPVFIAATVLGMVIYFRNLHIAKGQLPSAAQGASDA